MLPSFFKMTVHRHIFKKPKNSWDLQHSDEMVHELGQKCPKAFTIKRFVMSPKIFCPLHSKLEIHTRVHLQQT
jgi:hypothetical protein